MLIIRDRSLFGDRRRSLAPPRLIVGISGATSIVYGIRMLQALRAAEVETHLVMSRTARLTLAQESYLTVREVLALADAHYSPDDRGAALASGSVRTRGMVVAPCSVKTLAEIATGSCDTLLAGAADMTLKEQRRLVLMVCETPLTLTHLRNMATVTENGGIIAPPVLALSTRPADVAELVDQTVSRVLDLFDIDTGEFPRWPVQSTRSVRLLSEAHQDPVIGSHRGADAAGPTGD